MSMERAWHSGKHESTPIIFCTFDLETAGLGGALLAGTVCNPDGQSSFFSGVPDAICQQLFACLWEYSYEKGQRRIWYAHNAQYDWRYLLLYALRQDWKIEVGMRSDTDIYQIKILADFGEVYTTGKHKGKIKYRTLLMRDSYAIFLDTLANFTRQFSPDHQKLSLDFAHVQFDPDNPEHRTYALRDVESLRIALINYDRVIRQDWNVGLRGTQASTAFYAWQKTLGDESYFPSEGISEQWGRDAYYGGLVFLTSTECHENVRTYDLNSCYPDRMRTMGVPLGRGAQTRQLQFSKPAFYDVTVRAPANLRVAILPTRINGAMYLPSGTFRTTVTNDELAFAMEHGYQLLQLHGGYEYEALGFPFTAFVNRSEKIRKESKGLPRDEAAKRMQNSVYGKFGTRRVRRKMLILDEGDLPPLSAEPWFIDENIWIIEEEADIEARPEWSAWITAQGRLKLLRAVYAIGPEKCLYGDTDSLTIFPDDAHYLTIGAEYGQWKLEKSWMRFRAIAPKVYAGVLHSNAGPSLQGAAKGLNKNAIHSGHWRDLMDGKAVEVTADSLCSLLHLLRDRDNVGAKRLTRRSTDIRNSRNAQTHYPLSTITPKAAPTRKTG